MKVVVFGASGRTGRHILTQALAAGHEVTGAVRRAEALAGVPRVKVVEADVLVPGSLRGLTAGADAVLSAIGIRSPLNSTPVVSQGTANIVYAMKADGARRLVCVSAVGVGAPAPTHWLWPLIRLWLKRVLAEHGRQEALLHDCGLNWTAVRPPTLTDGPRTGRYGIDAESRPVRGLPRISRADVAEFLLMEAETSRYPRRVVTIGTN